MTRHTLLRNLWDGRIVSATPAVVVADTAEAVVLVVPPGTRRMRADFDALPPPAWELRELTWRPPAVGVVHRRGRRHSVGVFPDGWDVVLQHPWVEVPTGFDRSDWILRLWLDREGTWTYRDEDAFDEAVSRGVTRRRRPRPSGKRRATSSIVHRRRRSGTRSRRSRWRLRRCRRTGTSCLPRRRRSGRDRPGRGSPRGGEVVVVASSRRTTARVAALPAAVRLPELRAVVPSGRSVGVGLALLVVAFAAYFGARTMSVFAVRQIEIAGGSPLAREQAADALRPVIGASLLEVDSTLLERRLTPVPQVASVRFDRDFPHTLSVFVVPEHPVLLLRRGKVGWVVSARGRVMRRVTNTRTSSLPRMWVPPRTKVVVGSMLDVRSGGVAPSIFGPLAAARFPAHVEFVRGGPRELTLVLRSRMEVRLGNVEDLRLKLAIARRILLAVGAQRGGYVDVSVPERPVVRPGQSQVVG